MGRKVAVLWQASFSVAAGVLYFYFVLPRWPELMGDTTHGLGTTLRIVTGVLFGLTALPVVFTLLRTRKPELGTPQLALTIRTWSIVADVLAGVLIVGTAISEIWLSLDTAGQWLFAIYGAAAAIALLGFAAFYLSFVAEMPPPPPKPLKPKKAKERRIRRRKGRKSEDADETEGTDEPEETPDDAAEEGDDDAAEVEAETVEADTSEAETVEADQAPEPETEGAPVTQEAPTPTETKAAKEVEDSEATKVADEPRAGLRNRRPTGKTSHRRRRPRGGVAVEE
ncbi:MAG: hypothetical protein JO236_13335 [Mycobacterium sp.]|uniref:hypothetical protein n=1 Tax=Mycobacterium sp. TaxID=1785 RepID=UPI001EC95EA1|nr:hypothetical protein [Mycobacterium sp.]MBW0018511.1 hypothetical protein [Mycobacterium sp.]